jgi:hypothetical protein
MGIERKRSSSFLAICYSTSERQGIASALLVEKAPTPGALAGKAMLIEPSIAQFSGRVQLLRTALDEGVPRPSRAR